MLHTRAERFLGALVFLYAFVLYTMTVAPTASFWDSGEFIAIANRLQVSHPPGAPFYMLLGRFFSMFIPVAWVSLSVNMVSVLASALTIWLTYLIIVDLVREWQGPRETWTTRDHAAALGGGAIGAAAFAATDSFWFNAVEAEVYALSMFFTAIVTWLILRWTEVYREDQASGRALSRYDFSPVTSRYFVIIAYLFGLATGVHLLNLLSVFFVALIVFFVKFDREEWTIGQRLLGLVGTGVVSSLVFFAIYPGIIIGLPELMSRTGSLWLSIAAIVALVGGAIYITQKRNMQIANVIAVSFAVVLIGYSTYALIFIRSAADPPIDENDPENLTAIVSYLKREQYGETPSILERMHSPQPQHQAYYRRYASEGEFFWKWQVNHMYVRYFMWNFVGRESDAQDAGWITGFEPYNHELHALKTPSERHSRNAYYGLPFLLGLIGLFYHFRRDWRRAFSVLVLFFVTGIGIIIYLNQTPPQPRERDYSYVASFFAFSLWIGIGAAGLIELAMDAVRRNEELKRATGYAVAGVLFLAVPVWMAAENYFDHDRSGRYVAPDYAHNLLISAEEDAVVFTNGDNDTFPLWYLQEVEGVRQDVRVACLSLMNTPWYLDQLKNQTSRLSSKVPMSLTDEQIRTIQPIPWQPREVSLPVDLNQIRGGDASEVFYRPGDIDLLESPMTWRLEGRPFSSDMNLLQVSDQATLAILTETAREGWNRPVYFANTTGRESQLNLQPYFQLEGLAYRVVPLRHNDTSLGRVVPEVTVDRLRKFRLRNLDNPSVYFDENIRRMMDNYRLTFAHTAQRLAEGGDVETARALLDTLLVRIPYATIPSDPYTTWLVAQNLERVGRSDLVPGIMKHLEPGLLEDMALAIRSNSQERMARASEYLSLVIFSYMDNQDFEAASALYNRLADLTGDENYRQDPDSLQRDYEREQQRIREQNQPSSDTLAQVD